MPTTSNVCLKNCARNKKKLKLQQKWGENKKGCKIQGGKNEIFTFLVCCVVVSVWVSLCVKATKKKVIKLYSKQQLKTEILKPIKFKDELLKGIRQKCDLFAIRKSKSNKQNTKWQKIQSIVWVVCAARHQSLIKFDLLVSLIFYASALLLLFRANSLFPRLYVVQYNTTQDTYVELNTSSSSLTSFATSGLSFITFSAANSHSTVSEPHCVLYITQPTTNFLLFLYACVCSVFPCECVSNCIE